MSVKNYAYNNKTQLTKNINVSELKCKGRNHTHTIKIELEHIKKVQAFMNANGYTKVIFSRGYSCESYNKLVGGSSTSQHVKGTATDQCFYIGNKKVSAKEVCCKAQDFGFKGIAYINQYFVHLDSRTSGTYRGDETKGYSNNVGNDFYKYFGISKKKAYTGTFPALPSRGYFKKNDRGTQVRHLQNFLNWANGSNLVADGIIGNKTIEQVKKFQKNVSLVADGLFGKNSLSKAKTFKK